MEKKYTSQEEKELEEIERMINTFGAGTNDFSQGASQFVPDELEPDSFFGLKWKELVKKGIVKPQNEEEYSDGCKIFVGAKKLYNATNKSLIWGKTDSVENLDWKAEIRWIQFKCIVNALADGYYDEARETLDYIKEILNDQEKEKF